ncbi:HET-domain-containing protein, partial [Bimuria novae-zelandiae CBS 107.79]
DLYEPLDHSKTSFRLLQVLPTRSQEGHVQCKLFEASIEDWRRDYTCLSYVWGPPNESTNEHIVVINGKKHSGVDKKRQLYLQEPLWIDALCIDQNNIGERSHQVSQMGEIYSHSKQVIAWLG